MLDKIGITATSLCALHCILLPVILPALPLLGLSFLADHFWEHVFLILTAIMGTFALFTGFKRYHDFHHFKITILALITNVNPDDLRAERRCLRIFCIVLIKIDRQGSLCRLGCAA